ncbi:AraC family transcriptional regulator [Oceanobacter mangrovi]|uniref:AraC family transcriptional regulator n=1 Tax=Oceanobacter mangrovi TaxID=2862510 RepID=UPI001C8EE537|nr:AraC family transcriptional regulator [Oceanobacter mangrovi]
MTRTTDLDRINAHMAAVICSHAQKTGDYPTAIDGLGLFRRDQPTQPDVCLIQPSVVMVMQGRKIMHIGEQQFPYDTRRFLITSLDLPASSQVVEASPQQPCVGLVLQLDLRLIAELAAMGAVPAQARQGSADKGVGLWLSDASVTLVEPFQRLLSLLDEPAAIDILAPMIKREIHFRLLQTDQAQRLRQIASIDSQGFRIAKAIDWLKLNYAASLKIDELATRVQMSTPTFHHHFRQLTGMSPLQYQKWLRLNEAKRLMLNEHLDASSAAYEVGYESPSQFSREYSRLYGAPPKRDIENLRLAMRA